MNGRDVRQSGLALLCFIEFLCQIHILSTCIDQTPPMLIIVVALPAITGNFYGPQTTNPYECIQLDEYTVESHLSPYT